MQTRPGGGVRPWQVRGLYLGGGWETERQHQDLRVGDSWRPSADPLSNPWSRHQLRCSEAVPGKRWGCNIVPCGHTVGHRALSECAPECELKSGLRLRHWPLHGAERHGTPYRHRHRRLQQPDHHRPGRAAPRGLPWHQQHPSASPHRDWRNGAGGAPNPRQASYGRDTQCRSSHPCSCCFATTNTKSAGSRGRKNRPLSPPE